VLNFKAPKKYLKDQKMTCALEPASAQVPNFIQPRFMVPSTQEGKAWSPEGMSHDDFMLKDECVIVNLILMLVAGGTHVR